VKRRGALLGAGNIALRSHAPHWARDERLRSEVEIVAVADLATSNLAAMREFLPHARTYATAEALLEREQLDFCDICTPPFTHRRLIGLAAQRGLHVLCEKPLALSLADAEQIGEAVRNASIVFRLCHQYHYSPQWQAVRAQLPRLGRLYLAEYRVLRAGANQGNANWAPAWRTQRAMAGGGILVDHGTHILYQLRAALGDPRTVQAIVCRLMHRRYDVEDTALVTLDYGDRLAHVSLTWAAHHRAIQFRFVGERGELIGNDEKIEIHADRSETIQFADGMSRNSSHAEWYTPLLREFSAEVREGGRDESALDEALHVARVIETAYESARVGRALPLAPIPALERVRDAVGQDRDAAGPSVEVRTTADPVTVPPREAPGRRHWSRGALVRGAALVGVAVLGFLTLRKIQWQDLAHAIRTADVRWLLLAAALNLGVIGLGSVRWLALLRPLSRRTRWRDTFEALAVGLAVSMLVPARGGEVARIELLHQRTGLPKSQILGTVGLDQLVNAAGLMVGLATLPWLGGVPGWLSPAAVLALVLFAAAITGLIVIRPRAPGFAGAASERGATGWRRLMSRVREGMTAARNPWAISRSVAASLAAWLLELVVLRCSLRALGIALPFSASVVVLMAVNVMLAFPMTPANLGTLEIGATLGLLGFGVAKERALAFALCYHALQALPTAILGLSIAASEGLSWGA
jgi:predicted dehydrogenase/uncharacterized membrane protein YbhN (UPF0104 family)